MVSAEVTKRLRDHAERHAGYRRAASPSSPRATSASFFFSTSKTRSRCDQSFVETPILLR